VVDYNRKILVSTLTYHGRDEIEGCQCGWAELGKSHPEHVANVYEMRVPKHTRRASESTVDLEEY
jgi:hypothetical protein